MRLKLVEKKALLQNRNQLKRHLAENLIRFICNEYMINVIQIKKDIISRQGIG